MKYKEILFEASNGVGWIRFNRPEKLNSFSNNMVELMYKQLLKWKGDPEVAIIVLEGEGEKSFSAGGDVRELYDLRDSNLEEYVIASFSKEYSMDMTMHLYPKPILAYMDGYVMGGGVGVSVAGSHRIATGKTKWAMPETSIGLYPDVGASYFMNKMPGYIGRYLALTAKSINAADAIYARAADYYIDSSSWADLRQAIAEKKWFSNTAYKELSNIIEQYNKTPLVESSLAELEEKINKHFGFDRMEDIVDSLREASNRGDEWADKTLKVMLSKSPTSLKVTLKQLVEGKKKSMKECFMMELEMAVKFMKCHDFFEGVRSVLVDKDRAPNWNPPTLEEAKEDYVASFFVYSWKDGKNPLEDFEI